MAADASGVLGAPQVAGGFVMPRGAVMTAGLGAGVGGVVGGLAAEAVARKRRGDGLDFGRIGYVAVTSDEVAVVKAKTGAFKPKVGDEVIERVPRTEVASAELDGKLLKANLTITFTDGGEWRFDVPKAHRKGGVAIVNALGGRVH